MSGVGFGPEAPEIRQTREAQHRQGNRRLSKGRLAAPSVFHSKPTLSAAKPLSLSDPD